MHKVTADNDTFVIMRGEAARRRGGRQSRDERGRPGGRRRALFERTVSCRTGRTLRRCTLTVFNLAPSVDLALHLDVRRLCRLVDRKEALDESKGDQVRLGRQDRPLKCCEKRIVSTKRTFISGKDEPASLYAS